jgi:hypothetical protein
MGRAVPGNGVPGYGRRRSRVQVEQQGSITTRSAAEKRDERTKRRVGNPGFVYGSA